MRPRPPSLATLLAASRRGIRAIDDRARLGGRWSGDRLLRRYLGLRLLGRLECSELLLQARGLALGELGLALLQHDEQRRRDEDRRVGAGENPHQQGECEVLQSVAAEEEQGGDREERDERRRERPADRLPERL